MRVAGIALGVGGREDGVHQHEGAHNLRAQSVAFGVAMRHTVGTAAHALVEFWLKPFHHPCATDRAQALAHYVEHCSWKCHLSG